MSDQVATDSDAIVLDVDSILKQLDAPNGEFPEAAIRTIQRHGEPFFTGLIALIDEARLNPGSPQRQGHNGHITAMYLLTEFRVTQALPMIIEVMSLPDDGPFDLFGDLVTESLHTVFAMLGVDQIEVLTALVRNRDVNEYVRGAASRSLATMVGAGLRDRDTTVTLLRELLQEAIRNSDPEGTRGPACVLLDLYPEESLAEIREALPLVNADEEFPYFEERDIEVTLSEGKSKTLEKLKSKIRLIEDTAVELRAWLTWTAEADDEWDDVPWDDGFDEALIDEDDTDLFDEPFGFDPPLPASPGTIRNDRMRVGRNDPCPCGSGRKFKKCCGPKSGVPS
jgi:hypothetical protein